MKGAKPISERLPDGSDFESTTRGKLQSESATPAPAGVSAQAWQVANLGENLPTPGTIIASRYRVEREIGSGGMGVVLAARHLELGHLVAIKFLSLRDEMAAKRFVREARICAGLSSEHIVRVFDNGQLPDGTPYMVMEHLQGQTLSEYMAEKRVSITEAVDIVRQVCAALADAHGAGIVHRDLKPSNLFRIRRSDGTSLIKVLDFGISKVNDGALQEASSKLTRPGGFVGTQHYASPEQLSSSHSVDRRADIWAAGTVLYELLTGQRAFPQEHFMACWIAIAEGKFIAPRELRPEISPELEAVVQGCLQVDPKRRFATSDELARALEPHRAPEPARGAFAPSPLRRGTSSTAAFRFGPQSTPHVPLPPAGVELDRSALEPPHLRKGRQRALRPLSAVSAAVVRSYRALRGERTSPARGGITLIALGAALALAAIVLGLGKGALRLPPVDRVQATEPVATPAALPVNSPPSVPVPMAVPDTAAPPAAIPISQPAIAVAVDEAAVPLPLETASAPATDDVSRPDTPTAATSRRITRLKAKGVAAGKSLTLPSASQSAASSNADESRVDRELAQWVQDLPQSSSEPPAQPSAQGPRDAPPALEPGPRMSPPHAAAYLPNGGFAPNPTYPPQVTHSRPDHAPRPSNATSAVYPRPAYRPSHAYPPTVIYTPSPTPGYVGRAGYRPSRAERRSAPPSARPDRARRSRPAVYSAPKPRPARAIREVNRTDRRRSAPSRQRSE